MAVAPVEVGLVEFAPSEGDFAVLNRVVGHLKFLLCDLVVFWADADADCGSAIHQKRGVALSEQPHSVAAPLVEVGVGEPLGQVILVGVHAKANWPAALTHPALGGGRKTITPANLFAGIKQLGLAGCFADMAQAVVVAGRAHLVKAAQLHQRVCLFRPRKIGDFLHAVFQPPAVVKRVIEEVEHAATLRATGLMLGDAGLQSNRLKQFIAVADNRLTQFGFARVGIGLG